MLRSFPQGCQSPAESKIEDVFRIVIWENLRWKCGLIPAMALCWILWQTEGTWLGQSGQSFAKRARTCIKSSKCKSFIKKYISFFTDNCSYQTIWRLVTLYLWYSVLAFKSSMLMSGKPESNSSNSCSLKIAINLGCKSLHLDHRGSTNSLPARDDVVESLEERGQLFPDGARHPLLADEPDVVGLVHVGHQHISAVRDEVPHLSHTELLEY